MFRYTRYVMYLAPLGVGAALAVVVGNKGVDVLFGLGKLIATMYASSVLCIVFVLGPALVLFHIPVGGFYRAVREPFLIGFSTASSEAALPLALENMEQFGVPKHIVGFVIPTGLQLQPGGQRALLSLAAVFVAQAAGVNLSFGAQLLMMLTLMLTSKGVAGVPRAALVILAGTLSTFHLPMEGAAVLLGVDALLDMARTSVNVLATAWPAPWWPVGKATKSAVKLNEQEPTRLLKITILASLCAGALFAQTAPQTIHFDIQALDKSANACVDFLPVRLRRMDQSQSHPARPIPVGPLLRTRGAQPPNPPPDSRRGRQTRFPIATP